MAYGRAVPLACLRLPAGLALARRDVIVVSFKQPTVDRFHELVPAMPVAPGVDAPATRRTLAAWCADGIMTARPAALAREFRSHPPTASCPG